MCLKRLNYDRKELERRREESVHQNKGELFFSSAVISPFVPQRWDDPVHPTNSSKAVLLSCSKHTFVITDKCRVIIYMIITIIDQSSAHTFLGF